SARRHVERAGAGLAPRRPPVDRSPQTLLPAGERGGSAGRGHVAGIAVEYQAPALPVVQALVDVAVRRDVERARTDRALGIQRKPADEPVRSPARARPAPGRAAPGAANQPRAARLFTLACPYDLRARGIGEDRQTAPALA